MEHFVVQLLYSYRLNSALSITSSESRDAERFRWTHFRVFFDMFWASC